jgi:chlorophyll synthase/bacteriochlorophyll c synthase
MCLCGAFAAGRGQPGFHLTDVYDLLWLALGMIMIGPLATGFSQSINDYFDRELDAINDPARPIPAGDVTLREARFNWIILGIATILVSLTFRKWEVTLFALFGLILAVAYSVPPIKLKKHAWLGAPSVGLGYVCITWLTMHLVFAPLNWSSIIVALINGVLVSGLLFLNDIKSIEGDRLHGLTSLTVKLGLKRAVLVAYTIINGSQIALLLLVLLQGHVAIAGIMLLMLIIPVSAQIQLYQKPSHNHFLRYNMISNPFVALIQILSALVVGGYFG